MGQRLRQELRMQASEVGDVVSHDCLPCLPQGAKEWLIVKGSQLRVIRDRFDIKAAGLQLLSDSVAEHLVEDQPHRRSAACSRCHCACSRSAAWRFCSTMASTSSG